MKSIFLTVAFLVLFLSPSVGFSASLSVDVANEQTEQLKSLDVFSQFENSLSIKNNEITSMVLLNKNKMKSSIITINGVSYNSEPVSRPLIRIGNIARLDDSEPLLYGRLSVSSGFDTVFVLENKKPSIPDEADVTQSLLYGMFTLVANNTLELNNNYMFTRVNTNAHSSVLYFDGLKLTKLKESY